MFRQTLALIKQFSPSAWFDVLKKKVQMYREMPSQVNGYDCLLTYVSLS